MSFGDELVNISLTVDQWKYIIDKLYDYTYSHHIADEIREEIKRQITGKDTFIL